MSATIISRHFWQNTKIQAIFIGICAFMVLSLGISRPLAGWHDWNSVFFGSAARNHLRYGLTQTKLGVLINAGPKSENLNFYVHHPVLMPLLLALSFQFFGIQAWATRLVPVLSFVVFTVFLFLTAKKLWGTSTALLASVFITISPLTLYYSKIPVHETIVMGFIGFTFWAYINWLQTKRTGWYTAVISGLILSQLTSWAGFYLSAYLPIHALIISDKKPQLLKLFYIFTIAPLLFTLHLAHSAWIKGEITYFDFIDPFLYRINATNSSQMFGFTWGKFIIHQSRWMVIHFTRILIISSLAWVFNFILNRWRQKPLKLSDSFLILFLIFGITHTLLFHQQAFIHEYILTYMLPFIALSAGVTISHIYKFIYKKHSRLGNITLTIVLILVATERLPFVRTLNHTGDANPGYHLGRTVNQITHPEDQILILNTEFRQFYETYFNFYADRAAAFKNSLTPNDASDYDYIVIPLSHDYVSQTDKLYLYTHFPHQELGGGVIFKVDNKP